ncbi:MAG: histidine phosphatase family protein [Spirochaetes bacterium]|nr:histidine phosphatase family protein [Spirochaetota bacterium]
MIYLVRHGETTWNREHLFRGRKDPPLSAEGKRQAALVARFSASRKVGRVYSSPLRRAKATAEAIAASCECRVTHIASLTDIDFGEWEGKSLVWVKEHDGARYDAYRRSPGRFVIPGGESLADCYDRVYRAFIDITSKHETWSQSIAVVSHRVVLKLILIGVLDAPLDAFWKIRLDTCSVSKIDKSKEGLSVRGINIRCHLHDAVTEDAVTDDADSSIDF